MEDTISRAEFDELKNKLDTILDTVAKSEDKFNRGQFKKRTSDRLGKYEEQLKKLNGDDFDIYNAAYDEYNGSFKDVEEDSYIAQLTSEIDNKLNALREALGQPASADVEVKSEGEGEAEVRVEDEDKDVADKQHEEKSEEDEDDEKSEYDRFLDELDEEAARMKR